MVRARVSYMVESKCMCSIRAKFKFRVMGRGSISVKVRYRSRVGVSSLAWDRAMTGGKVRVKLWLWYGKC
jgi:hypothetical protein